LLIQIPAAPFVSDFEGGAHYVTSINAAPGFTPICINIGNYLQLVSSWRGDTAMSFTDKFRQQHDEILATVGELNDQIKAKAEAQVLRGVLSNLAGKLNFHLAMEDKALYPRIMKDGKAQALATKFRDEMGGLGDAFTAYSNKWQASAIRNDPAGFAAETRKVFTALGKRIARENAELYPLADQVA
jgi:Hemerythrin HHE cation binding domain